MSLSIFFSSLIPAVSEYFTNPYFRGIMLFLAAAAALNSVGIDLGTSNSAVSYLAGEKSVLFGEASPTVPSLVYAREDGTVNNVDGTPLRAWKRALGLRDKSDVDWRLSSREIKSLRLDDRGRMVTKVGESYVAIDPAECSRAMIEELLRVSEGQVGGKIDKAVIGAPATYLPAQRDALTLAAQNAGLSKVQIVAEPELAVYAYGLLAEGMEESLALVVDLGGGTLDLSFVQVGGMSKTVEIVATSGDSCLGGLDFTNLFAEAIGADAKIAEKAKIELTTRMETELSDGTTVSRKDLEKACAPLLKRIATCVRQTALQAGVSLAGDVFEEVSPKATRAKARKAKSERDRIIKQVKAEMPKGESLHFWPTSSRIVDHLVLVGAATRMPAVQKTLTAITGCSLETSASVDPDLAVSIGAAIRAAMLDDTLDDDLQVFDAYQAEVLRHFAKKQQVVERPPSA